jgi:hypothetical protein
VYLFFVSINFSDRSQTLSVTAHQVRDGINFPFAAESEYKETIDSLVAIQGEWDIETGKLHEEERVSSNEKKTLLV